MEVYIVDPSTGIQTEIPYNGWTISEALNEAKTLQLSLDYGAVDKASQAFGQSAFFLLSAGYREIYVEKNGTRIFSGTINDLGMDRGEGEDISISLAAAGYFSLLGKRRTGAFVEYTSDDSADIAWGLIDDSQTLDSNADLGITRGTHPTTKTRDRTFRFDSVKDAIIGMSNAKVADGYDFEVDDDKVFNIFYPTKGSERPGLPLDIGNIKKISLRKPLLLSMTNRIFVLGQDDNNYVQRDSPSTYQETFGNLEDVLAKRDVIEQATLEDAGDKVLGTDQSPQLALTVTHLDDDPAIEAYNVGDWLPLTFEEAEVTATMYRVIKRTIQHNAGGDTQVTLSMRLE